MKPKRNYCLTINNPEETDEDFLEYVKKIEHLKYFVFQREVGEKNNTPHFQAYIEFTNNKTFQTMKTLFPRAHIEARIGTKKQARDYCMKEKKEVKTDDGIADFETRISGPYEYGDFVDDGERSDLDGIMEMIEEGKTENEIRLAYPSQFFRYYRNINQMRQVYLETKYGDMFREVEVIYIYGNTGIGKTKHVKDLHGYANIFRVTKYDHAAFDGYKGQNVIVFEEFRNSFKIEDMLNYLDGHPIMLPSRYNDKVACYTKVYITTNWALSEQYKNIQKEHPTTWKAFLRRIKKVYNFDLSKEIPVSKNQGILMKPISMLTPIEDDDGDLPF